MSAKVALVTGGAKRVGRAIVEKLAREGFSVAFTYLRTPVEEANSFSQSLPNGACAIGDIDFTEPQDAVERVHKLFSMTYDHLDVLVNNASLYVSGRLRDTNLDMMRKV